MVQSRQRGLVDHKCINLPFLSRRRHNANKISRYDNNCSIIKLTNLYSDKDLSRVDGQWIETTSDGSKCHSDIKITGIFIANDNIIHVAWIFAFDDTPSPDTYFPWQLFFLFYRYLFSGSINAGVFFQNAKILCHTNSKYWKWGSLSYGQCYNYTRSPKYS